MTVWEPSSYLAGYVGGRCTPVHPEKGLYKDNGLRKGPQAIGGVRIVLATKVESVHGKVSGEDRERAGCMELI